MRYTYRPPLGGHPPAADEKREADSECRRDVPQFYTLALDPLRAETRDGEEKEREPLRVVRILENAALVIEVVQYPVNRNDEPVTVNHGNACEPQDICSDNGDAYAPDEIHYLGECP